MDWVANDECWNQRIRPIVMDPGEFVIDAGYSHSGAAGVSLTMHADTLDQEGFQYAIPQLEQTAVRVVGSIFYGCNSDVSPSQSAFMVLFNARVAVATQAPGLPYTSDTDRELYDLGTPYVANEDFLWHYHDRFIVDTDFWEDTQLLTPDWRAPQKVPVDIRVSRRLKQREILVLYFQAALTEVVHAGGQFVFNPINGFRVWADPQLRTLVRTIT